MPQFQNTASVVMDDNNEALYKDKASRHVVDRPLSTRSFSSVAEMRQYLDATKKPSLPPQAALKPCISRSFSSPAQLHRALRGLPEPRQEQTESRTRQMDISEEMGHVVDAVKSSVKTVAKDCESQTAFVLEDKEQIIDKLCLEAIEGRISFDELEKYTYQVLATDSVVQLNQIAMQTELQITLFAEPQKPAKELFLLKVPVFYGIGFGTGSVASALLLWLV